MMEQKVKQRPIVVFNHDVTEEELAIIPEDFNGDIVVHGNLTTSVAVSISGNLWVLGDIDSWDIIVGGDLYCKEVSSCDIEVEGNFICEGGINSYCITVGGDFTCSGRIDSHGFYIDVRGKSFIKKHN